MLKDEIPSSLSLLSAGSIATALLHGVPTININPAEDSGAPGITATLIDANALITIPVVWDDEVVEAVVLCL